MTYREKTAWLTFLSMAVAYSLYFGLIIAGHPAGREMLPMLWLFGPIAATQALVVIAGHIALAMTTPAPERKADERDRAINRRGAAAAYYVMMVGMIVVGVVMPFTDTGMKIVNTALFAIVIAETVSYVIVLLSYRRGWHG